VKTRKYAEEIDGYNLENKEQLLIKYATKLESEAMHEVLERVAEATLQSGMRFMKTIKDETVGEERIYLDAEDCSASVVNNFTKDLVESDHDYDFKSTRQSMDHIVIRYQNDDLIKETESEDEE